MIKTELYQRYSRDAASEKVYCFVFNAVNDSIESWVNQRLTGHMRERLYDWQVDSLICFNKSGDKCIMAELVRTTSNPSAVVDNLMFVYGVKIENKWYYFNGPGVMLPREMFKKDIHTPLTFSKLHEIAMEEIFNGYLKKNKENGKWEINEEFFTGMENKNNDEVSSGYGSCFECRNFDEYVLYRVNKNWEKRDTLNYKPLRD